MASSSTNKQPMLVDRPLNAYANLGPVAALTAPGNFASISQAGLVNLITTAENEDGAMIDSITVIANEANLTAARVLIFLTSAASALAADITNTAVVASAAIVSTSVGSRAFVELLPILTPVPRQGGLTSLTEQTRKNTGLFVPKGKGLFCGLTTPILLPTPASSVSVFAQGGFY